MKIVMPSSLSKIVLVDRAARAALRPSAANGHRDPRSLFPRLAVRGFATVSVSPDPMSAFWLVGQWPWHGQLRPGPATDSGRE